MYEASDILKISLKEARTLFPGDDREVGRAFRRLASLWHPDRNSDPKAATVFARLVELRDHALSRIASPSRSDGPVLVREDGRSFRFRVLRESSGPLGPVWVGRSRAVYVYEKGFEDVAQAEVARITGLPFADGRMRSEMSRFLPEAEGQMKDGGGRPAVVVAKKPSEILLSDLVDHLGGRLPAVHAAWVCSGLMNIACYLQWASLFHGGITAATVFVDPAAHSVALRGGWGFATAFGARPSVLPQAVLAAVPRIAPKGAVAAPGMDGQCVRAVVQEALGHPGGGGLAMNDEVPAAVRLWLQSSSRDDAFKDYADWQEALVSGWGKRKFEVFGVCPEDVYG